MKKILFFAASAAFAFSTVAQSNKFQKAEYRSTSHQEFIDEEITTPPLKGLNIPNQKAIGCIPIGTAYNIYTILGDRQNQVAYNPDLDLITFVHRQNDGKLGGSGIISFDYSTDGGNTWTINPFQITPALGGSIAGNGNRYPNITIYNPTGNTNTANAYIVATGPQLANHSIGGNGWAGTFRTSTKLDSTDHDEKYVYNTGTPDPYDWGAAGLSTANGMVWDASTTYNNTGNTVNDTMTNNEYFINKGTFNSTNKNFDWTVAASYAPQWVTTLSSTNSTQNVSGLMNMAWSPNGQIGYAVHMAAELGDGTPTTPKPYIMKTTDGGATWTHLPNYDFTNDPTMQTYIYTNAGGTKRPFFSSFDLTVDVNGDLHIFGEVLSGFSSHPDSLNYILSAVQTQFLMECVTNNGTSWNVNFVDSIYVEDYEWDTPNQLSNFTRPQASRNAAGTKVFYTWNGSDLSLNTQREFPDIWAVAKDISTGNWTSIKNLSENTCSQYSTQYQTMAEIVNENGLDKDYELPIVYAIPQSNDGSIAPQFYYHTGIGFDDADFLTSVEEVITDNNISIYPNPSNGVITITIDGASSFNYTVIDAVGKIVAQNQIKGGKATLDLTNNNLGVYFVKIESEGNIVTKKVVVTE